MKRRPQRREPVDLGSVSRSRVVSRRPRAARLGAVAIFGIVLLVAAVVGSSVVLALHTTPIPLSGKGARASLAVVIQIDGLGPGDISAATTPNLHALVSHGTSYSDAWIGQLEESPASSAASISTGVFPRSHGVIGPAWTDPRSAALSTALDPGQVLLGSIDQVMESHGVPSLAKAIKTQSSGDTILAVGGSDCATVAAAGTWLADYILCAIKDGRRWVPASVAGHRSPGGHLRDVSWSQPVNARDDLAGATEGWTLGQQDSWVARYAVAALRQTHPRLATIDFPEIGLVGPYLTPSQRPAVIRQLLSGIDQGIGSITTELRKEGRLKHTVFAITSGETFTPLLDTVDQAKFTDAIQTAGGNPVYTKSDGMAMIGLQDSIQAQPVAQAIQGENVSSLDSIYFRARNGDSFSYGPVFLNPGLSARDAHAQAYLLKTLASAGAPDVVAGYAPGVGTNGHAGRFPRTSLSIGMNWEDEHIPLILSGQGVFPGIVSAYPARLVDLAPTLEAMLGLDPTEGEGVVLADAMYSPPGGASDKQHSEMSTLLPIVEGLKQRQSAG